MVVAGNEHVDAFLNSIQVVKNVFSPLETSIRKAAKDFEQCWPGSKNGKASNEIKNANFELGLVNSNVKKTSNDEKKKGLALKFPVKMLVGIFPEKNGKNDNSDSHKIENISRKGLKAKYGSGKKEGDCTNCLHFVVAWSLFINGFVQAIPIPFKKKVHKDDTCVKPIASCKFKRKGSKGKPFEALFDEEWKLKEGKDLSFEYLLGFLVDQITQDLQKLDNDVQESENLPHKTNQFDHLKAITTILEGNMNGLLSNLKFARVGGVPSSIIDVPSVKEESDNGINNTKTIEKEDSKGISPQKLATGLLSIPLSNVERLRSTLSTVSLSELVELLPQLGRPTNDYPDKKKLFSVQDFFRYTEAEGRRFFEELDRDGDGQVNMEDLEVAIRKRKLPKQYASEFMRRARSHLFSKSFGWKQFLSLVEQKEPTILRAYTGLCLSKSGTLQKSEIMASLKNAGLPAYEDNAIAMMRFLNSDTEESISYGHFRNFMLLLPSDRLQEDPRSIWFEAATVVAVAPPVVIPTGSYLKSALAGGLACALSTALLHPVDTIKTQVQASTLTFPEIIAKLPQIGARGLYKGSIPAIWGQFSSHGLRTGIFEASKIFLINFAPTLPELQVQSVASFCGTFLGTAVRIPCEVLKQRLQAGLFDNVGQALVGTWERDGLKGFFRGTGATLFREIPFYVCGMGLYAESKKVAQRLLGRELEAWETITVGALSGGFTAVLTTPFDVIKTRMMTAPQGRPVSLSIIALSILRHEGPLGLFKGALPRFFWIAPLGAMNFAGYELAKKAMDKNNEIDDQKKLATS